MAENVLFGSEFEGRGIVEGVNEVVEKLAEIKQALKDVREETTRLNKELDNNQKELTETKTKLDEATKAGDPKKIKDLSDQITTLTAKEKDLKVALKDANTEMIVLQKGAGVYSRQINETVKNQLSVNEQLGKFASVSRVAGEAVGRFRTFVQEAAFGLVSGFAGAIIAQAIPALLKWGQELLNVERETDELRKKHELMNAVLSDAASNAAASVTKLQVYRKMLNDTSLSETERVRVAKEYNKTAEETNKIDTTQINNLDLINQKIDAQNKLILERAKSTAALSKITEAETKAIDSQLKFEEKLREVGLSEEQLNTIQKKVDTERTQLSLKRTQQLDNFSSQTVPKVIDANKKLGESSQQSANTIATFSQKEINALLSLKTGRDVAQKSAEDLAASLSSLITVPGVTTKDTTQPVQNAFAQKLAELRSRLAATLTSNFQSEPLIVAKFKAQLEKEFVDIGQLLKDKKLTIQQADILKGVIKQINSLELAGSLAEFRKKVKDEIDKINDQIAAVALDDAGKRINNIRDSFEKERAQIEQGFEATVATLEKANTALIKQIDDDVTKGLVSPAIAKRKKFLASVLFGDLSAQALQTKTNQELDLSFNAFQRTVTESNAFFEENLAQLDENIAKRIVAEKDALTTGAISYETFQKRVTALLKQQKAERDAIRKEELESDLTQINVRINSTTDPEQLKKLQEQARQIRTQIAAIDSNVEGQKEDPTKKRIDNVTKYAQSVGSLLNSIGSFWQQINAIEQKSLERSISLQQKRVDEARTIAERGNAEYLNQEQDRLDQLELKRAASARKQQAINSALVLSNALLATVSAIAQAASTSGPAAPFAAIAAGIAVIGAITAAFQFVSSLQPPVPEFRHGTEDVQLGKNKPGIDTVPAKLTAGERVVTVRENKEYFETLTAIHNRKVSPEVLNSFVRQTLTGQKEGQREKRIERTVIERFREKAEKDRLTKEDRQLTREIANQVSAHIINNTEKDRVFNYVEHVLTQKFESRPLIVPRIMKLIREQVTEKQASSERTTVQQVSSVIESFSERIKETINLQKYSTTFASKYSKELIKELTKVINNNSDRAGAINLVDRLTERIYNPELVKVIVPFIKEKLQSNIQNKVGFPGQNVKEVERIIERFAQHVNKSETEKVINNVFRDQFIKENHDYRESIEAILDKKIESKTVNAFVREQTSDQKSFREIITKTQQVTNQVLKASRVEIPVVSYQRLEQATTNAVEMKGMIGEQIRIMKENNELQKETHKVLKAMGFKFTFDRNGVSAMMMAYMEQQKIDLKS